MSKRIFACVLSLIMLSACLTGVNKSDSATQPLSLKLDQGWTLQALDNNANVASASQSSTVILETHLRRRQALNPKHTSADARYKVQGRVKQWHYSGNVSAQPVVALDVDVFDTHDAKIVWSDSVSATGKRRETLSGLADRLLRKLVDQMPLSNVDSIAPTQSPSSTVISELTASPGSNINTLSGGLGVRTANARAFDSTTSTPAPLAGRSTAFYYSVNPPINVLSQFDRLVLEPDNVSAEQLRKIVDKGSRPYAYLSVGEVGPQRAYAQTLDPQWILGRNSAWDSSVLDLTNSRLREFLLDRVAKLQVAGFQGLFLDTMDSFNLVADTKQERSAQKAGLVTLIQQIAKRFPDMRIITNRGFEVLDDIAQHLEAVAAESLYASWDNVEQKYTEVSNNDREWLLSKLKYAQQSLNLDVISIDYLPPERRGEARTVAAQIAQHGFIPWIANPSLDYVGIGALEVLPRKVLMIYDSAAVGSLELSAVHRFVATPVEYLGYVPEYLDIATQNLPAGELKGRYAGIVTWQDKPFEQPAAGPWLQKQLDDQVPVVLLGVPPVTPDDAMLASLGINNLLDMDIDSAELVHSDNYIKPERSLSQRVDSLGMAATSIDSANSVHMSSRDKNSKQADVVVTGPFGGYAWQPGVSDDDLDYETYWIIDPFKFLRTALQIPDAPMPDVTSENGKRMWLAHIDGDALPSWAEMPGKQLGAEVIYNRILKPYQLPHTVSIVEGEMTDPAYNDRRERMFEIAKKTFALDNVELASHTYSHPFKWSLLKKYGESGRFNLHIPGYRYSAERETAGSIKFIDRELAPSGKSTEIMLWSGDALPGEKDLAVLERLGIPNMNGGLTSATNASPSLSLVSPMARPVGNYLQVYAPIMNENLYTNDWTGPFNGFRRVIETFELTEKPRRLKPLNIYYHFYSGTKTAAMKALEKVYDWSLQQDIFPLYASDFAVKIPDYRNVGVARYLDGQWKLSSLGNVRSIRMLSGEKWPELADSQGISGARSLHDGVYMHTDGANQVLFRTRADTPPQLHLVSSNGRVLQWNNTDDHLNFRIRGEIPVSVELGGHLATTCSINADGRQIKGVITSDNTITFTFTSRDTGNASLNCPA